jgi:hypothetical protein
VALVLCSPASAKEVHSHDGQVLRPIPEKLEIPHSTTGASKQEATSKTPAKAPAKAQTEFTATPNATSKDAKSGTTNKVEPKENSPEAGPKSSTANSPSKGKERKFSSRPKASLVPPPPPGTPSMMLDPGMSMGLWGMPVEYMSKEALKDKAKELTIQYKDAQAELESKKRVQAESQERADGFDELFAEGVVSRRELENSKRESQETNQEVARLETKCGELKSLLERVNKKLAPAAAKSAPRKLIH